MKTIEEWIEKAREQTRAINRDTGADLDENLADLVGQSRDSGTLERSNYRTIVADMRKRFPDDCEEHRFGHWAVGWVEEFFVRIIGEDGEPTPAFLAALEWNRALENYPCADEEDLSELESEKDAESWNNWGRRELDREICNSFPEVDLDLTTEFLDKLGGDGASDRDNDGSPIFPIKQWAESVERADAEAFGDFAEYDRARMAELPPYLREPIEDPARDALPPYLRD